MAAVTNENQRIANTAIKHNEQNVGVDDINEKTPGGEKVPHQNKGPLAKAIQKTSDKTLFEGGNVVRIDDMVATEDPHPGIAGGVVSHTYLKEAWAEKGSPNVLAEGKAPTRNDDQTQQNQKNSQGIVCDPAEVARLAKLAEEKLKRCSLETFTKAECSHGRTLSDDRVLEVVASAKEPETVEIIANRTNAVEADKEPVCRFGGDHHTEWVVSRKKGGGLEERSEPFHGDELILEPSWFSETDPEDESEPDDLEDANKDAARHADDAARRRARAQRAKAIHERSKMLRQQNPAQAGSVTTATQQFDQQFPRFERDAADRAKAERTKYKNGRETINEVRDAVEKIGEIVDFLKCWFAYKDPVRVTVQAQACTGGLGCELVAYPADEVKWKITEAEKGLIKRATDKVEKIANFLTGLFAPLGNIDVSMKAFEGADVSLVCQWKELTKDAPRPGKKIYQCNPKLELQFNVEELVSLEIKASIPLARILDMVVAGSGYAVQKACNWFGLTAQAYISVELKVGITLGVRLNEYWEGEPVVSITFTFKFALGMELRYKNNLHIDGKAAVEATATFDNPKFEPDALIAVDFKWGIKAGFEGQIYVSIWWFEYNQSGSHYPESWKYEMKDPATLRPLKPLLALVKN